MLVHLIELKGTNIVGFFFHKKKEKKNVFSSNFTSNIKDLLLVPPLMKRFNFWLGM